MNPKFKKLGFILSCLLLVLGGGIFYFCPSQKPLQVNVGKELKKIPKDDRDALEWFFRTLNCYAPCSYVLFGDKPMSIYTLLDIKQEPSHSQMYRHYEFLAFSMNQATRDNLMKVKGWELWKKYRASFPSSNFVLFENLDHGYITLSMINRRSFLNAVEMNIDVFRNTLGSEITPQVVLDRCIQSQNFFKDVLKCDDTLLGILLGYGRHNALLFSRRNLIKKDRDHQNFSLTKKAIQPSEGFKTIEEEYDYINKTLSAFDKSILDDFNPLSMALPFFVADPDDIGTKELKAKYRQQYKQIVKQYENGDFLEVTLNRFCNYS